MQVRDPLQGLKEVRRIKAEVDFLNRENPDEQRSGCRGIAAFDPETRQAAQIDGDFDSVGTVLAMGACDETVQRLFGELQISLFDLGVGLAAETAVIRRIRPPVLLKQSAKDEEQKDEESRAEVVHKNPLSKGL